MDSSMTDRPTPEQAITDWPTTIHPGSPRAISDHVCHAEVPDIIPALEAAGYVIIHSDDIVWTPNPATGPFVAVFRKMER